MRRTAARGQPQYRAAALPAVRAAIRVTRRSLISTRLIPQPQYPAAAARTDEQGGVRRAALGLSCSADRLAMRRSTWRAMRSYGGAFFTCEQVGTDDAHRIIWGRSGKNAATLYPRVVDPQNFIQLTSILTFESDRQNYGSSSADN